ncbi:hypothetical protein ABBQ32_010606 [Trebouxia sp. C0010 RCD-2024]
MTWGAEEEKKTLQHPKMPPWLSRWRDCLKQLEVEKKAEVIEVGVGTAGGAGEGVGGDPSPPGDIRLAAKAVLAAIPGEEAVGGEEEGEAEIEVVGRGEKVGAVPEESVGLGEETEYEEESLEDDPSALGGLRTLVKKKRLKLNPAVMCDSSRKLKQENYQEALGERKRRRRLQQQMHWTLLFLGGGSLQLQMPNEGKRRERETGLRTLVKKKRLKLNPAVMCDSSRKLKQENYQEALGERKRRRRLQQQMHWTLLFLQDETC